MHQAIKKSTIAVRLADLIRDLELSSTFIDTGMDLISGESLCNYPPEELRERGLFQLAVYREQIGRILDEMEELRASITS